MTDLLRQTDECLEIAKKAREIGDDVGFIAAVSLAAQLVQLARIQDTIAAAGSRTLVDLGLEGKGRKK